MGVLSFLVLCPLVVALLLLIVRGDRGRSVIVWAGAIVIAAASVYAAVCFLGAGTVTFGSVFGVQGAIGDVCLAVDLVLVVYIIVKGVIYRKPLAIVLAVVQGALVLWTELSATRGAKVGSYVTVDALAVIMVLIIGIIGSGICVYAIGYMRDYRAHEPEGSRDRRPTFFAFMFAFLSAMFLLVVSNDMRWLLTAWEATTVCSFSLIGWSRTQEAVRNSFLQIWMNLVGGIAMTVGVALSALMGGTVELSAFVSLAAAHPAYALPVALLSVAGLVKAAQMPFHPWLLGAMVAPTPTSALLHSSTMVKAGVFLLIRLSPALGFTAPGIMVMLVGGATFMLCSFLAISQSNGKRVLAYSTIANLGLIAACAGTGTAAGVWAAVFLLVFHACAKSLLFLCVGTAEHHIGSRDIESMDLLFTRMPHLARLMMLGIMVMFVAPFGMLVSKWAALQAFADSGNLVLVVLLAFGSAATFLFWAKWLGKLSAVAGGTEDVEGTVWASEKVAIVLMAVLAAACCVAFPALSGLVVTPWLSSVFGPAAASALPQGDLVVMAILAVATLVVVLGLPRTTSERPEGVYLSGLTEDPTSRTYRGSLGAPVAATQSNWYLPALFGEARLGGVATWTGSVLMVAGVAVSLALMLVGGGAL